MTIHRLASLFIYCSIASPTIAAECPKMSLNDLLARQTTVNGVTATTVEANLASMNAAKNDLASKATSSTLTTGDSAGTLENFLSPLTVAGLGGSIFGNNVTQDDDTLIFDYNIKLGDDQAGVLKLRTSFNRTPELFPALLESIDAGQREDFKSLFEGNLDLTDDITFGITYSFGIGNLGKRTLDTIENVFLNTIASAKDKNYQSAQQRLTEVARRTVVAGFTPDTVLTELPESENRNELCAAFVNFANASTALDFDEDRRFTEIAFIDLINNRPQLYLGIAAREADLLAGPDEVIASLTYEWGFKATFEDMRDSARSCGDDAACTYGMYQQYAEDNAGTIKSGDRFKLAIEYVDIDDYQFANSVTNIDFSKKGHRKLSASFGYGRSLSMSEALNNSRIDFELKHEDVSNDPDRQDRSVGVLTLTKKLQGGSGVTFPFTILYSNKPEFVDTNSDDKLTAHIGIKWDMAPATN